MVITTTVDGGGAVDGVTITTQGTGYGTGDELTITGTNTGVATFDITVQANDGTITLSKVAPQLDAISFVHHTNRISVSPLGLEVMN